MKKPSLYEAAFFMGGSCFEKINHYFIPTTNTVFASMMLMLHYGLA